MVFAECVFVLESFYEAPRAQVATTMRALLAMPTVTVADQLVFLRSLEVYEEQRLHFAEAQLVARGGGQRSRSRALVRQRAEARDVDRVAGA